MRKLDRLRDESGQAVIFTLLCMTVLLGFVAFAVDVGMLFRAKRNMQIAADSAAIAGAAELNYGDVTAAAQQAAMQNGVANGTNGGVVAINNPPLYGAFVGNPGYVEAIVSQSQPTFFMKIFNWNAMMVSARAVAYNGAVANDCIYVLSPSASDAMDLQGSFDVSAPGCGVVVDSNSPTALNFTGGGGTLTAGSVGVVGGDSGKTGDSTPTPITNMAPVADPLVYITPPNPAAMSCNPPAGGTLTGTVYPSGGVVCYSGNVNINNATLNQGTYVFTGNVQLSGAVATGAGGATLDIASGSLTESTGATLDLVAPTTGAYNGIAIMQPAPNSNVLMFDFGSSSGLIEGIIYAPDAELELHDSGGDSSGGLQLITDLIVNTLYDQTATLSIKSYSQTVNTSPLTRVALAE